MKRVLGIALALIVAAPCSAAVAAEGQLSQAGRWLTDDQGRTVVLHGVNMVYKRPPYVPADTGFGENDARFLAEQGFNTVRLGVIYAGVEPSPGVYDDAYLDRVAQTVEVLARHRIHVQIDFHQDLYNERYQGEGFPDWAVQDDGLPAAPQVGFPGNYPAMPALNRAFDHFWANDPGPGGVGLQDRYAAAWRHVAERFRDHPYLMGYDILNEPWPGSVWPTCASNIGCPAFDSGALAGLSRRVIAAIRQRDSSNIVWYEPNLLFNFGADSAHPDTGDSQGFSFHNYCLLAGVIPGASLPNPPQDETCGVFERNFVFENAEKQSRETGDALLLSEFGATDDLGLIRRLVDFADDYRLSWQYWHYCTCDDPTTSGSGGIQALVPDPALAPGGANLRAAKLDVLARAYPQIVAGTPSDWKFDADSKRFDLAFSTRGPGGRSFAPGGVSQVFVPPRRYGASYRVEVAGAEVTSEAGASRLTLRNCDGAEEVRLTVTDADAAAVPDCAAQARSGGGEPADDDEPDEAPTDPTAATAADTGELPFTGLDLRAPLVAGLLLLAAGATLRAAGVRLGG